MIKPLKFVAVVLVIGLGIVMWILSDRSPSTSSVSPFADSASLKSYVLPAEFLIEPVTERGAGGEIYISGRTNFPHGMKMWVVLGPRSKPSVRA